MVAQPTEERLSISTRTPRDKYGVARATLGELSYAERLLLLFCRHPAEVPGFDGHAEEPRREANDPLLRLRQRFPDIDRVIAGRRVLDFGCGAGEQSIALAAAGAREVVGVDIAAPLIARARRRAAGRHNVSFATTAQGGFDAVICQDAFEHFADPESCLRGMLDQLAPGGRLYLTFGPLWFSPYGAHCYYFTALPWVHLIFSERTVHRVMTLYRRDPGHSYSESMNRMTVARFHRIIERTGCIVEAISSRCIKRLDFFSFLPLLREIFVNEISCEITKKRDVSTTGSAAGS